MGPVNTGYFRLQALACEEAMCESCVLFGDLSRVPHLAGVNGLGCETAACHGHPEFPCPSQLAVRGLAVPLAGHIGTRK